MTPSLMETAAGIATLLWRQSLPVLPLIGLVWLLGRLRFFRDPRLQVTLWSLVFVRLVVFGSWAPLPAPALYEAPVAAAGALLEAGAGSASHAPRHAAAFSPLPALMALYATVVCLLLLVRGRQRAFYRRLIARAEPVTCPRALGLAARWRAAYRIRRRVRLVTAADAQGPFTMGTLFPVVFLPRAVLESPAEAVEAALAHELAHVRAWDDLNITLQHLIGTLFFFHPAVHFAGRRLNAWREIARDRDVVATNLMSVKHYGLGLLAALRASAPGPAAAPALSHRIRGRVAALVQGASRATASKTRRTTVAVLGLAALPLIGFAPPRPQPATQELGRQHPLPGGRITSGFGPRRDPFSGKTAHHTGIDLSAPKGTDILAPASGRVLIAGFQEDRPAWGIMLVLQHDKGYQTYYAHLAEVRVAVGDTVQAGQTIGTVGDTGRVTAPHLNLELHHDGTPIDAEMVLGPSAASATD